MKDNLVITGPNASGKTTILKSVLFNVILSHQFGVGCYAKGSTIPLYEEIHCYLNIPDTSGRDSLFQAEARRCKDILDRIQGDKNKEHKIKHFCIFDELFSGTNPDEAISSSFGFIKYLIKTKKIDFALTTHLSSLCSLMDEKKVNRIRNKKMETKEITEMKSNVVENKEIPIEKSRDKKEIKEHDFMYTYKLIDGISRVKGGIKVLRDLMFPKSILRLF